MHPGIIAQQTPDKPAYIMADSGFTVTFRQLDDTSNQGAQLFRQSGLRTGDHVALLMENHPRFLQICWAAQRAGLYYTAISYRLQADEVDYILKDCGARCFITSHAQRELAAALAARQAIPEHSFMLDGTKEGYAAWEDALARQPATPIADESEGADMLYSSGTTGRPKGIKVPLTGVALGTPSPLLMLMKALYFTPGDMCYLSPAPLYHAAPLRYNVNFLRTGSTCIIMEKFEPEHFLQLVEKYRVTHCQMVPTLFIRLLKLPEAVRRQYDVSSLKVVIHAAAPCPVDVKEKMIKWWGPIIHEYYAGTEGNGFTAINSVDWLTHKGSVGRALLGQIKIIDDDTGAELPPGQTGTVYFANGPAFSYHNDPEKTAKATHPQGWTTLGDVGHVDNEGYLYLTDRKAYMIISGGVNIYPQEAEDILVSHPRVADVAVFGVPNPEFGEEVKAVVQPVCWDDAGPALAQELIDYCRSKLSHIKCPKSIDFDPALPRHPTGKLYKRLLRDRYWK